jgi:outer membrane receptor for Fe3+-dicitrate
MGSEITLFTFVVFSLEPSQYNFLESKMVNLKYSEVIGNVFDMPDWDC